MTEKEMYLGAAQLLRERGWCRYEMTNAKGQHCLIGALCAMAKQEIDIRDIFPRIYSIITGHNLWPINDSESMTQERAIALLELAAECC